MKSIIILSIILITIFGLVLLNIYHPIITTNFKKLANNVRANKNHNDELAKTDKIIAEITSPNTELKSVNTRVEGFEDGSIYKKHKLIDANGCYEPTFSRCDDENGERGYKIFTPFQNDCLSAGRGLTEFDAAFAQVDKYLNNMPNEAGSEPDLDIRRATCIKKPTVKQGLGMFGLCNRLELTDRYCALDSQKEELAGLNPGLEVEDLERGMRNMELIHSVCFPDTTMTCATVTTNPATSTTLSS